MNNKITIVAVVIWMSLLLACEQEPYKQGRLLYENYCIQCHQADGKAYKKLYPPIAQADYLVKNKDRVPCIIYYGMEGELEVNGVIYNQNMPAHTNFNDIDIANLVNYINNNFGNDLGYTPLKDIQNALNNCEENPK